MASDDSMVIPNVSEQHSFWKWGSSTEKVDLRESPGYLGDWLGLKTMDQSKKLDLHE